MWFLNPEVTKGTVDGSENLHLDEDGSFSHYLRDLIWFDTSQVVQDIFYYPLCNLKQHFGSLVARILGDVAPIGISVFCTPCMSLAAVFHVTRTQNTVPNEQNARGVAVPLGGALLARDPEGIARDIIKSCLIWLLALKKSIGHFLLPSRWFFFARFSAINRYQQWFKKSSHGNLRGLDVALYVRAREFFLMRKSFIQSSKPSNHTTNSAFGLEGVEILPQKNGDS